MPPRYAATAQAPQLAPRGTVVDAAIFARVEVLEERTANLQRFLDEIDRRYEQRFNSVDATITGQKENTAIALSAQQKATETAMTAAEKAVAKADIATEKRFDSVNEFRAQLSDQAVTFVSRTEYLATLKATDAKVDGATARLDSLGGRSAGLSQGWATLVGAILLALTLYAALRPH